MFYEEHTQHGNAHRNLTVFSAFPLSALVSHLCLRSYNWALLLLSLPVVPDSSLFRHHFAVSGRSKQERHNFPWISSSLFVLLLWIYLLLLFTSLALSLQLCFFFSHFYMFFGVTWVENESAVLGRNPLAADLVGCGLSFPRQPLSVAASSPFCWSPYISILSKTCSRVWMSMETGSRAIPDVALIPDGENFRREHLSASAELQYIGIQQFPHFV